jgi:hypothetical protein
MHDEIVKIIKLYNKTWAKLKDVDDNSLWFGEMT